MNELLALTNDQLRMVIKHSSEQVEMYEKRIYDHRQELAARIFDVRPGFVFKFQKNEYKIKYFSSVPVAVVLKADGRCGVQTKRCEGWLDWKSGKSDSPFKRAPLIL